MYRNGLKISFDYWVNGIAAMLLIIVLTFLLCMLFGCNQLQLVDKNKASSTAILPNKAKDSDKLQITYKDALVGEMTVKQFKTLMDASEQYSKLLECENSKRIKIELKDNPWEIEQTAESFKTDATLIWLDKNNAILKKVTFQLVLNRKQNKDWTISKIDEFYTKTSRVLFPTFTATTIVLIIVLMVLL